MSSPPLRLISLKSSNHNSKGISLSFLCKVEVSRLFIRQILILIPHSEVFTCINDAFGDFQMYLDIGCFVLVTGRKLQILWM